MPPPAISVIIATYNWSAALRCAVRSVLLQTLQDFEILVVGDGCTDDTEAVVADFKDPRIRWHNLETNWGSQWAPNNFGLQHAAADWVAYLGHDDIWYPTHLEAILRTARETQAALVTSVMILYGSPGSGIRGLAGIFAGGLFGANDFVPPSGIAHRRSITDIIGFWLDPETSGLPVDAAYLRTALATGLPVASTNELTTFKFNAAWRRDAYKLKSTAEQEEMLDRIETGIDFRHVELLGVLHARVADKLIDMKFPAELSSAPVAVTHRANRRFKGLERRFAAADLRRLEGPERFHITDIDPGFEWHLDETDERFGPFRWTGPAVLSAVDLPVLFGADLLIRIHVIHSITPTAVEQLKLFVNSRPVEYRLERTASETFVVHGLARIDPHGSPDDGLRIGLEVDKVLRPIDLGVNEDHRWLGIAVNWIEVEPIVEAA
jgi:glycosyltransferase involved in cell wall biosynthesis